MSRPALVRRGLALNWLTIAYNVVEAVVAIGAGVVAGSVALLAFGLDSVIEVTASGAAQWRLRADVDLQRRAHAERMTLRLDAGGQGVVDDITYFGHDQLITVVLDDGVFIRARTGPAREFGRGDRVSVSVTGPVVTFPVA